MNLLPLTIAQAGSTCPTSGSPFSPFIMMALLFGAFYFMMIRPQRRRDKERKAMIANVKVDDRVLLTSGILGKICSVNDTSLLVQVADKTKIEVIKAAVSQVLEQGEVPGEIEPSK